MHPIAGVFIQRFRRTGPYALFDSGIFFFETKTTAFSLNFKKTPLIIDILILIRIIRARCIEPLLNRFFNLSLTL
jgi:hypothetical protein